MAGTRAISHYTRLLSLCLPSKLSSPITRSVITSLKPHQIFKYHFKTQNFSSASFSGERVIQELLAEVERERKHDKDSKKFKEEDDVDFLGIEPLIEKMEKKAAKDLKNLDVWEPADSESEDEERWSQDDVQKRIDEFERKCKRHGELLRNFANSETFDDAHKWMTKIDRFEQKYLKLPVEYRVIGETMNRLKESTGKERFILLQKLNRALKLMATKEAYDPNNPANFAVIQHQHVGSPDDLVDNIGSEQEKAMIKGANHDDDEEDFNEAKEKDDILLEKLNAIEKKIEQKLELLDHTFGKKGRVLEEEIRDLVEERNSLTAQKRRPLYRKGFGVKLLNVNRTVKVTKGGQLVKYSALIATGNYNGVVGYARAKAPNAKIAIQRAYEKCFQNLHYVDRYEGHTIAHAINMKYEKTKIYLWPGTMRSGMAAGQTVETILHLAGYKNVKSKIIGSRNPLNVVKTLFKALTAEVIVEEVVNPWKDSVDGYEIETPKDVQEKFGRTVVESYLV